MRRSSILYALPHFRRVCVCLVACIAFLLIAMPQQNFADPVIAEEKDVEEDSESKPEKKVRLNVEKNVGQPVAKTPEESAACIQINGNLTIEVVAAEPLIADPVAFDWAPDGSLWVVEMGDYPLGVDGAHGGKVRRLTDTDGDGRYDKSTTFLDGIGYPTGIKVWRDGVLVSAAPEVFLARDTDGDGKCDQRETLFRGFIEGNQQHRVNGLRWGLDGWLHLANGDSGGEIESVKTGRKIDIRSSDLKINPDTGGMIATFGRTQFGRNRDDWGHWVGGNNSNPMWQFVLDQQRLGKTGSIRLPELKHEVPEQAGAATIYPISKTLERFNDFDRANRITSACSHMFYRDTALGDSYYGNAFICEPVHNLVHREVVSRDGIHINSRRADSERSSEFLASTDSWFRPVMIRTGPDGSLWVADMYRLVIEHPEWIPEEWQQKLDLRSGNDMGRIYRVSRRGSEPKQEMPKMPNLAEANGGPLLDALSSSNGTLRDMAQQIAAWGGTPVSIRGLLERVSREETPAAARLQLLATAKMLLRSKGRIRSKQNFLEEGRVVTVALNDENPHVIAQGIEFCYWLIGGRKFGDEMDSVDSGRWKADGSISKKLRTLFDHPDPAVQLELAYSYRHLSQLFNDDRLLYRLIVANQDNPHFMTVALSRINAENAGRLARMPWQELDSDAMRSMILALVHADNTTQIVRQLYGSVLADDSRFDSMLQKFRALDALQNASQNRGERPKVELTASQQKTLDGFVTSARTVAADVDSDTPLRVAAIRFTGQSANSEEKNTDLFFDLLDGREPPEIQSAGVQQISRMRNDDTGRRLLQLWQDATPSIRFEIFSSMARRSEWALLLLESLKSGDIPVASINSVQLEQLRWNLPKPQRETLANISPPPSSEEREALVQNYLSAVDAGKTTADATRGRAVFKKTCAACHKIGQEGNAIGPDLTALTDKSAKSLIVSILDPNRAVEQKYTNYVVDTVDGLQYSGVLKQETGDSIQLLSADQKTIDVPRSEIESIYSGKQSYMPEGMEREITKEQMNDLVRFLQSGQDSQPNE